MTRNKTKWNLLRPGKKRGAQWKEKSFNRWKRLTEAGGLYPHHSNNLIIASSETTRSTSSKPTQALIDTVFKTERIRSGKDASQARIRRLNDRLAIAGESNWRTPKRQRSERRNENNGDVRISVCNNMIQFTDPWGAHWNPLKALIICRTTIVSRRKPIEKEANIERKRSRRGIWKTMEPWYTGLIHFAEIPQGAAKQFSIRGHLWSICRAGWLGFGLEKYL